jgi:hypothetical protein
MSDTAADQKLSTNFAACLLSMDLGLTEAIWAYRLANWRKPGRRAVIPHEVTEDGHPVYSVEAIQAYINEQRAKQKLTAEGPRSRQPRPAAIPMFDGEDTPHVRVMFATGGVTQSIFAIDAKEARRLAASLVKSAEMLEKYLPA